MSTIVDFTDADISVFVKILRKIDMDKTISGEMISKAKNTLVQTAIKLANEYLTGNENFANIILVREAGFDVYAAEQDRFGWLIGAIKLKRGILYFG